MDWNIHSRINILYIFTNWEHLLYNRSVKNTLLTIPQMKISKLDNTLSKTKSKSITFYVDCCCCCCCCILYPLGNLAAEATMKKIYKHEDSIKSHFGYNFVFFTLSLIAGIMGVSASKDLFSKCKTAICDKSFMQVIADSDFIIIAGLATALFYYLMYLYSKKWLTNVDTKKRLKVVLVEVILTLLGVALFAAISLPVVFLGSEMFN